LFCCFVVLLFCCFFESTKNDAYVALLFCCFVAEFEQQTNRTTITKIAATNKNSNTNSNNNLNATASTKKTHQVIIMNPLSPFFVKNAIIGCPFS
jgi:hypothetical protein